MSDVLLYQTADGPNIEVLNSVVTMTDGPATAVYLSFFGGNEDDPGGDDTTKEFWGNSLVTDPAKKYRSEVGYLINRIPATSGNLKRLKTAADNDLAWTIEAGLLKEYTVTVSIPRINWIKITVDSELGSISFVEPWEISA